MAITIKLGLDEIGFITTFENFTKTHVKDCIINKKKDKITFIVDAGHAGAAIGKAGVNIKKLEQKLNKKVEVLEFSQDPLVFISNIFRPIKITNAYISEKSDGSKILYASVAKSKLGMVKAKMNNAKQLIKKYYNFDEIIFQ